MKITLTNDRNQMDFKEDEDDEGQDHSSSNPYYKMFEEKLVIFQNEIFANENVRLNKNTSVVNVQKQ